MEYNLECSISVIELLYIYIYMKKKYRIKDSFVSNILYTVNSIGIFLYIKLEKKKKKEKRPLKILSLFSSNKKC